MNDVKGLLQSRTVWSGLVALLGVVAKLFGHDLVDADQTALVDAISTIATAAGSIGAIYFRVVATKAIGTKS